MEDAIKKTRSFAKVCESIPTLGPTDPLESVADETKLPKSPDRDGPSSVDH